MKEPTPVAYLHRGFDATLARPLRESDGKVVGFVGRNTGQPSFAKYKNPPRTAVYDKSVNLYQPLPAPKGRRGQVVVVEGTLDALAIAVAAIRSGRAELFCPVTQSGRELSAVQVRKVIALHHRVAVLGFDGDPAGRESASRYAASFAKAGSAVRVAVLDDAHDPASWLAVAGDRALSSWSTNRDLSPYGARPGPVPAASFAARHIAQRDVPSSERINALVKLASLARHLDIREAQLWTERVMRIAGLLAAADAQGRLGKDRPFPKKHGHEHSVGTESSLATVTRTGGHS